MDWSSYGGNGNSSLESSMGRSPSPGETALNLTRSWSDAIGAQSGAMNSFSDLAGNLITGKMKADSNVEIARLQAEAAERAREKSSGGGFGGILGSIAGSFLGPVGTAVGGSIGKGLFG